LDGLSEFYEERAHRSELLFLLTRIEVEKNNRSAEARETRSVVRKYLRAR